MANINLGNMLNNFLKNQNKNNFAKQNYQLLSNQLQDKINKNNENYYTDINKLTNNKNIEVASINNLQNKYATGGTNSQMQLLLEAEYKNRKNELDKLNQAEQQKLKKQQQQLILQNHIAGSGGLFSKLNNFFLNS